MPKVTLSEMLVTALTFRGCRPVEMRTKKYQAFERTGQKDSGGRQMYWFVGKSGALRTGANVTDSRSVEWDRVKFKAIYDEAIATANKSEVTT